MSHDEKESEAETLVDTVAKTLQASPAGEASVPRLANFRVLRKLGEGGMGLVYEAEQLEPIQRNVALKVSKWGLDAGSVVARFESERQTLALLSHGCIAKVYDAGATEQGNPYFAMELVGGEPITEYAAARRMTLEERLRLLRRVCDGVQHAHQKGVIHRDLKPSNILVAEEDGQPSPKVIDFGIAKAIKPIDDVLYTQHGQMIGTPEYMSPEQADPGELDIDIRTDVYSLGVILYELLVGELPFSSEDLRSEGWLGIQRRIQEEEPSKPSTRLSAMVGTRESVARERRTTASALSQRLKGDLDWIVVKALEKDRSRRYETVNAFSMDLERFLNNEPVLARPPSTAYRVSKFARRHRLGVAVSAVLLLALVLGSVGTTVGFLQARAAQREAQLEAETARTVKDFLVDIFEVSDPNEAQGREISAREILDRGVVRVREDLVDQPLIRAELLNTMGTVYDQLGLYDEAETLVRDGLDLRVASSEVASSDVAQSWYSLSMVLLHLREFEAAEAAAREALQLWRETFGQESDEVVDSLARLTDILMFSGDYERAEDSSREAVELSRALYGDEPTKLVDRQHSLGTVYLLSGRYREAEPQLREAVRLQKAVHGTNHPRVYSALNNLGVTQFLLGDFEAAEASYSETLEIQRNVVGDDHPVILKSLDNLGMVRYQLGDYEGAAQLHADALARGVEQLGDDHVDLTITRNNLALVAMARGDLQAAESLFRRVVEQRSETYGPDHHTTAEGRVGMAQVLIERGELVEAEGELRKSLDALEQAYPEGGVQMAPGLLALGRARHLQGHPNEAVELIRESATLYGEGFGEGNWETQWARTLLASALIDLDALEEARALLDVALPILEARGAQTLEARLGRDVRQRLRGAVRSASADD